jgi:hypothetical protein
MLEPVKNAMNTKNLRKITQNEEVRRMGRAAAHAGRELVKAFAREYRQQRNRG